MPDGWLTLRHELLKKIIGVQTGPGQLGLIETRKIFVDAAKKVGKFSYHDC
jgi:hypothetical protein